MSMKAYLAGLVVVVVLGVAGLRSLVDDLPAARAAKAAQERDRIACAMGEGEPAQRGEVEPGRSGCGVHGSASGVSGK